ncbi:hypothetical protein ACFL96_05270 [Thermoproteota archaeon]
MLFIKKKRIAVKSGRPLPPPPKKARSSGGPANFRNKQVVSIQGIPHSFEVYQTSGTDNCCMIHSIHGTVNNGFYLVPDPAQWRRFIAQTIVNDLSDQDGHVPNPLTQARYLRSAIRLLEELRDCNNCSSTSLLSQSSRGSLYLYNKYKAFFTQYFTTESNLTDLCIRSRDALVYAIYHLLGKSEWKKFIEDNLEHFIEDLAKDEMPRSEYTKYISTLDNPDSQSAQYAKKDLIRYLYKDLKNLFKQDLNYFIENFENNSNIQPLANSYRYLAQQAREHLNEFLNSPEIYGCYINNCVTNSRYLFRIDEIGLIAKDKIVHLITFDGFKWISVVYNQDKETIFETELQEYLMRFPEKRNELEDYFRENPLPENREHVYIFHQGQGGNHYSRASVTPQ